METFGKRMSSLRKEKKISQSELAKMLNTATSVVGRYEREEMKPSIEVAQKIASHLNTTIGFLLGEVNDADLFKDPFMLQRLKEILKLPSKEKDALLLNIDAFLRDFKTRQTYA